MSAIPRPALILGLLGLIPFVAGAAGQLLGLSGTAPATVLALYGAVILSFLGGTLWGFASPGPAAEDFGLMAVSVASSLLAFLALLSGAADVALPLPLGMLEVLALGFFLQLLADRAFAARALVPAWWMSLRLPLSVVAIVCLLVGAYL